MFLSYEKVEVIQLAIGLLLSNFIRVHLIYWNGIVEDGKNEGSTPAKKAKKKDSLFVRLDAGEQKELEILV